MPTRLATPFADGNYRFVPGVFPYSGGVGADHGYAIERARFRAPAPLAEGFARIAAHLQARGRPLTAFCACELRSPAPFTEEGFRAFNTEYVDTLKAWNIFRSGVNPVARSNVCPEFEAPAVPSFFAFAYTVPVSALEPGMRGDFCIAGSGEAPEGKANYRDFIVRRGDTSPGAMAEKARFVLAEMERRMAILGASWAQTTAAHIYTIHDIHALIAEEFAPRGLLRSGLSWQVCRPPVVDLEFEMDCRGVATELVI